jgi:NADP-dependent aldehyde dehydrogenase
VLSGRNLIAGEAAEPTDGRFTAPGALGEFDEASGSHVDRALDAAAQAARAYRRVSPNARAAFLDRIADALEQADRLLETANAETALPLERLTGERARTVGQLRMFARLVREGSWVDARIDRALPDRTPLPKPDVRRMLIPLGPVAVFAASNFPLAFSVAGGDTASALAAGCPVVLKAHPAHPATSELAARAIVGAANATGMPPGVFSLLHGRRHDVGIALVRHPLTRAVAFTGSLRGGRALFDVAVRRPDPIPVYAEMGSVNPVFVLPGALAERGDAIAAGLKQSVLLGVGQFCTSPGLTIGTDDEQFDRFVRQVETLMADAPAGTMLYPGLCEAYEAGVGRLSALDGVRTVRSSVAGDPRAQARPSLFDTAARTFLWHRELGEEVFGPSTVVVRCGSREEMEAVALQLDGQLTATIHGTPDDLAEYASLVSILEDKAGRLIFNGFPTGVEVCAAMQHGGPYPASTDSRTTSVGSAAIHRFARPVAWQNFPQASLPPEVQDGNPRGIWRHIDGEMTRS